MIVTLTNNAKKVLSFLRWRIKFFRYCTKFFATLTSTSKKTTNIELDIEDQNIYSHLERHGFVKIPQSFQSDVSIDDIPNNIKSAKEKPLLDVYDLFKNEINSLVSRILLDSSVSSLINNYFNHKPWLWNISTMYTVPDNSANLKQVDSQMWHFDYGDTKQLHLMYYLSNVDESSGPFTFMDAIKSSKIKRNPITIERINDKKLQSSYNLNPKEDSVKLISEKGSLFIVDPGRLLHQGARCLKPRLILFISISSQNPMSLPKDTINFNERKKITETYKKLSGTTYNDNFFIN